VRRDGTDREGSQITGSQRIAFGVSCYLIGAEKGHVLTDIDQLSIPDR
jgi:hypothetical protein